MNTCQVDGLVVRRHRQHLLHLATPVTRSDSGWFLPVGFRQGQCLRPTTSKDTTRIARAHQHRNRERHIRHAWEGLAGMEVSRGHLPCHTRGAPRMHYVTMKLQTFLFQTVVTSCIYNLYAPVLLYGVVNFMQNGTVRAILYTEVQMNLWSQFPYFFTDLGAVQYNRTTCRPPSCYRYESAKNGAVESIFYIQIRNGILSHGLQEQLG